MENQDNSNFAVDLDNSDSAIDNFYRHSCTYSPDDDKLRMTPAGRLPADEYAEIKAAGFQWAPKQGVFYAVWTPARETLMLEWCGEIDDEDTSLIDRAEDRAERFTSYHERRAADATRASAAVDRIASNIPFGQPILVGHHSEKRARREAAKIENGMRYAVKMWDTAEYWTRRAAGAIAHAKYKELPAVRARRVKGLESDFRKSEKNKDAAALSLKFWRGELALKDGSNPGVTHARAVNWLNCVDNMVSCILPDGEKFYSAWSALNDGKITVEALAPQRIASLEKSLAHSWKWIDHLSYRLRYEKAMLAEGGGLKSDGFDLQIGGQVLNRWGWAVITRLNKKAGVICSVSVVGKYGDVMQLEDIKDYRPPAEGDTEKVKAATKLPPLCNYAGEGFHHMTTEEYKAKGDWARGKDIINEPSRHRVNTISNRIAKPVGKSEWGTTPVFLIDAKVKAPAQTADVPRDLPKRQEVEPKPARVVTEEAPSKADELREQLKAGIKVVSAPQLFPTPATLAARMVELAEIEPGMTVLEPSAGTGWILEALRTTRATVTAVEINRNLVDNLQHNFSGYGIHCQDFLTIGSEREPGTFHRILMNPPFENGSDIKHIKHAFSMLKPAGKLVAICAGGPRQSEQLKPLADTWEVLPAGTFEESGTGVNTVLLTMTKPAENPVLAVEPDFCHKPKRR